MPETLLQIEEALRLKSQASNSGRFAHYQSLHHALLNDEYHFTLHQFPGGNDHGPHHIRRVAEYLDKLVATELSSFSETEIYLLLCAVLLHDQGMLQGRKGHARASQGMVHNQQYDNVLTQFEKEFVGHLVAVHSSREKIEAEFRGISEEETIAGQSVRPRHLAALLRLADELDEDHRRSNTRVFQKMSLEPESEIYWMMNRGVQSITPIPDQESIRITVQYTRDRDINQLYPLDGNQVNVLTALYQKIQKINREREYCMKFIKRAPRFSRIELTLREQGGESETVSLDDLEHGQEFMKSHEDLFVSKPLASPVLASVADERLWHDLTETEQAELSPSNREFASDALEIIDEPAIFGRWELRVKGQGIQADLSLGYDIFQESGEMLRVEVFPIGQYPIQGPKIDVRHSDRSRAPESLLTMLANLANSDVWQSSYRALKSQRLIHLVDSVTDLQDPNAVFRHHANEVDDAWDLDDSVPSLKLEVKGDDTGRVVTIVPSRRYPFDSPLVTCTSPPTTSAWLADGGLNWDVLSEPRSSLWSKLLGESNPLTELCVRTEDLASNDSA